MNEWLRRPPTYALAVSLFMLTIGTMVGAVLVSLQDTLYVAARREIVKRPEIHGFAGSEVIDQGRIAEVADQSNAALRLLHTHSLGIGVLILLATIAIANLPVSSRLQAALCVLVSLGAIYPLGWAVLAWLIPFLGVEALRGPVEWMFFVPFGGALILGLAGATGLCIIGSLQQPHKTKRLSRTMMQQRAIGPKNMSVTMIASAGVLMILAGLVTIEVVAIADHLDASALDPAFCSPTSLHTTTEPPETQLTRDYGAIRILLKDPADHFSQIRRVYAGDLHVSVAARAQTVILKRADRAKLFKAEYQRISWTGSLRQEAQRIDRERGTTLALTIDQGLQAYDRTKIEAAFREMFSILLDDLLISIQQRLDQSITVGRALQHARRFYGEGLDAHLSHQRARTGCARKLCP